MRLPRACFGFVPSSAKILVCIYVREASRKEKIPVSEPIPRARLSHNSVACADKDRRPSKNPALTGWHWNYTVPRARRPRTIPTAARAPGSIPKPAKQLSARRLSAMTPKAAKRTTKRRPARRKENQKPKSQQRSRRPSTRKKRSAACSRFGGARRDKIGRRSSRVATSIRPSPNRLASDRSISFARFVRTRVSENALLSQARQP